MSKKISSLAIIFICLFSLQLISCGGGSKLTLKEAEQVTLNFQGENFVPPPRGIGDLIKKIREAGDGKAFCEGCEENFNLESKNLEIRLSNISKMAIISHFNGETKKSYELFQRGLKLFKSVSHNDMNIKERYVLLNRFAMLAQDVGDFSDAVSYMEEAIKINENQQKTKLGSLLIQYSMLSEIHSEAGNLEEAEDTLDSAVGTLSDMQRRNIPVRIWEKYGSRYDLQIKLAEAKVKNLQGHLREAEELFRELLIDLTDESLSSGRGFNNSHKASIQGFYLVENLLAQGRIAEAEAESRKAVEFSLGYFSRDNAVTAVTLRGMAQVLMSRGEYLDAIKLIDIAEKIYQAIETSPSSLERAQLSTLLVENHIAQGNWESAAKVLHKMEKVLQGDKKAYALYFNNNLNWVITLANSGKLEQAGKVALSAYKYNQDMYGDNSVRTAIAKGMLAMIQRKQGNLSEAKKNYKDIVPVLVNGESGSVFNYNTGINGQRLSLIIESYLSVLNKEYKSGNKKSAEEAFYLVQLIQGQGTQQAISASAARASIKNSELISLVRKEQDAVRKIDAGYNKLASLLAVKNTEYNASTSSGLKSQLERLVKARESILEEIRNRFPEYDNLVRPKPVSIVEVKKILKSDEALFLTYSGNKNLYSWTLMADSRLDFTISNVTKASLNKSVKTLRKGLDLQVSTLKDIPKFNSKLAHQVYQQVLKPSAHLWRSAKNLIIVPDAVLGTLPFSVLVTENNEKSSDRKLQFSNYRNVAWLAKTHATSYSPSVITLKTLRKKQIKANASQRFIGFGNPDFGNTVKEKKSTQLKTRGIQLTMRGLRRTNTGSLDATNVVSSQLEMLSHLPETENEVLQVANALNVKSKGNVFLGTAANEERIKEVVMSNRRILMFASHALLPGDLDGLTQPAIALSSPKVTGSKNDGLLTMGEIMGLDLNADWVVLSACNTGAGNGKGATAISGLGQAFFYAGARSLLVSHWPVETTSAKEITTGLFEQQVKNKSLTRAVALNETVKDLIHNKTYKDNSGKDLFSYAHPVFWAPFTVVGDGAGVLN